MNRCVIFGGAAITDYDRIRSSIRENDYIVCCDSGLTHAEALGILPDLIIGDFDSHVNPHLPAETIVLPAEKDDTDTAYAVKEALRRGYAEFLMAGVIGQRMDHTLVNVSLLLLLHRSGARAVILDDYEEISLIAPGTEEEIGDQYPYFSLLAIDGPAEGVTITGAKYPLNDAVITAYDPYATSNEVLPGENAHVSLKSGRLLLIKVNKR